MRFVAALLVFASVAAAAAQGKVSIQSAIEITGSNVRLVSFSYDFPGRERVLIDGLGVVGAKGSIVKYLTLQTNAEIVDAGSSRLDRVAGERWLAIGAAAAAFDPLSSHGITAALDSGVRAGEAIANGAIDRYARSIDILWNAYTAAHRELYAVERRWPDEPFWQRRRV